MNLADRIGRIFDRRVSGRTRIVALMAIVALAAFFLGGLITGDGGPSEVGHDEHLSDSAAPAPSTWTCSMHPQIKLPKPGKCPICYMDLIPLETGGVDDLGPRQLRLSETAKQLARIQTTPAVKALAVSEVRMVGNIEFDESRVAYITAWVPGRLDRLYADYTGIPVSKGDHLVSIYSPELLAAQEELIQAQEAISSLDGTRSEMLLSTARATLAAAREKLRLFGLTGEQIDTIESSRKATDHLTIYAPIGGVVVQKNAHEGMYVETGTRIYTIAELSKLWVMFEAYESDLPWLRFGQRVEFTSQSFPGERFEATISFIDPLVDPKTRTIRVRAIVDNTGGRLKPDMFVRGVLEARVDRQGKIVDERLSGKWISPMHPEIVKDSPGMCDVCGMDLVPASSLGYADGTEEGGEAPLLIPATAPLVTGKRAVVYVDVSGDGSPLFEGREIELGPRAGDYYVVKSGIEEGELVVSNGAFKIDSELQIQAKPSMMSPETMIETSDSERKALEPVYTTYLDIWEALAADDLDGAGKSAGELLSAVKNVDMTVFAGPARAIWMESSKSISEFADGIANPKDMKAARNAFYGLSKATIELHRIFGHTGSRSFYLSFCPMARGGDGAYWLQNRDELLNPFYGASMLHCGSIEEKYEAISGEEI